MHHTSSGSSSSFCKRIARAGPIEGETRGPDKPLEEVELQHLTSHLEFMAAFDPGQTLVGLVGEVVLAAVVDFALLHTPGGVRVGGGELDDGRRIGIAGKSWKTDFRR